MQTSFLDTTDLRMVLEPHSDVIPKVDLKHVVMPFGIWISHSRASPV